MNIVYGANDKYVPFLGISLLSLLENNRNEKIEIHILSDGITDENKKRLSDIADQYNFPITFYSVEDMRGFVPFDFDTEGFHPVILARLFIAEIISHDCKRMIYLDCDTIVCGNLHELELIDLSEYYVGMVPELNMPTDKKAMIGIGKKETYYNSGVLLINLELWRKDNLTDQFMEFYRYKQGKLLYADQDILNYCCKDRIMTLPHKFNLSPNLRYFPRYFIKKLQPYYYRNTREEYKNFLEHPNVIHFMGDERPWISGNRNAYKAYFDEYRAKSVWKDMKYVKGQEWYMWCYHVLNIITLICPWFRILFSKFIGINKYRWFGKE